MVASVSYKYAHTLLNYRKSSNLFLINEIKMIIFLFQLAFCLYKGWH